MVHLVIFVNLFFIPMLPLYVIYRERQRALEANTDLLFQYGIVAACNIPLAKIPVFLIRRVVGVYIAIDSGYYTVSALLSTSFIILLYEYYKAYSDPRSFKEKLIQRGIKGVIKEFAPACILSFVSCFMLFVFEPILMYATNMNDFWFDFRMMIGPVLRVFAAFFLLGIVILFVIYSADLYVSTQLFLYKGVILAGFAVFFLIYLQGNWLAGGLPPLTGEEIIWSEHGKIETLILISAAAILVAAVVASIKKFGVDRTVSYTMACTALIFGMLFVSFITLFPAVVTEKVFDREDSFQDTFISTLENFNTISSNKNFLIFLVDSTDSQIFYDVMMKDDDFRGMMEDFTYYPDTLGVYPYTTFSIPNILTGTVYRNETSFSEYCSSAYNQSVLFEKLTQNNYGINLYSNSVAWSGSRNYNVENAALIRDISIASDKFIEQELKYIEFKYLPYGLKQLSNIGSLSFNSCKKIDSEYGGYSSENLSNYMRITESNVLEKQSKNYFQFIHCEGSHVPLNMDKNLNYIEGGTYAQKVSASLTMIKAYLQRLKDNGAYDNSVIIITSDHGYQHGVSENSTWPTIYMEQYDYIFERLNPILFIKGINEKHEMLESDCPVSFTDLQDAFCDLIDGKPSTELFLGLEPGRTRTVLWHRVDRGDQMIEYVTTGKAWELWEFTPTGNAYDLGK